jgi:hypothetical protein
MTEPAPQAPAPLPSEATGLRRITCRSCGRVTYEKPGETACRSCRCLQAPESHRRYINRKYLACSRCGVTLVVGIEAVSATCSRCTLTRLPDGVPQQLPQPLGHTPLRSFVQGQCANAKPGDACLWDRPCLTVRGLRCPYFEASVLPLATRNSAKYPGVTAAYLRLHPELNVLLAPAPTRVCACGSPLPRRRRLCDSCAKSRRREATRWAVARSRSSRKHLTEKGASISPQNRGVLEAQTGNATPGVARRLLGGLNCITRARPPQAAVRRSPTGPGAGNREVRVMADVGV